MAQDRFEVRLRVQLAGLHLGATEGFRREPGCDYQQRGGENAPRNDGHRILQRKFLFAGSDLQSATQLAPFRDQFGNQLEPVVPYRAGLQLHGRIQDQSDGRSLVAVGECNFRQRLDADRE